MRFLIPLLVLPSLALAQTPPNNRHLFYPGEGAAPNFFFAGSNIATRLGYGATQNVECYSDVSAAAFRGIGATAPGTCKLTGQFYVVQDGDRTTQNPFRLIVRKPVAPDGLPDTTAAGLLAQSNNLMTPIQTGTGAIAWNITSTWLTPITVPCETGYYLGVEFLPETSTTDITSTHGATTATTTTGDNPRLPAPKFHAVAVLQPSGTATRVTSALTAAIVSLTDMPTLNVANVDSTLANYKSYGIGGLYPAVKSGTRDDGITLRVQDTGNPGGICGLFLSTGFHPGGIALGGGITGVVWISPVGLIDVGGGAIGAAAPYTLEVGIAPPGTIPAIAGAKIAFTAVTTSSTLTNVRLTNAQMTSF